MKLKTDKDSHTPRTGHTEAAGRQNGHSESEPSEHKLVIPKLSTDDVRSVFVDSAGEYHWSPLYCRDLPVAEQAFDRWLDQVRAEAWGGSLNLSHSEQEEFAKAMFESLGKYGLFDSTFYDRDEPYEIAFTWAANGHFGFDAVEAGIKAVNRLRESTKEE